MQSVLGLDHVIILVRDLDAAEQAIERLGFRLTPRGVHSDQMGTHNSTIVLPDRTTYFEVLSVRHPTAANEAARNALAEREGLFGLAFKTDDAQVAAEAFAAAGLSDGEVIDFARPVELPDGTRDAAFTVARTRADRTPGAWLFVCQHHTPEVVWREDYLEQPNGAHGLHEIVGVAPDPAALAEAYGVLFTGRIKENREALEIEAGSVTLRFLTPAALEARYGEVARNLPQDRPALAALVLSCGDLERARTVLTSAGIPLTTNDNQRIAIDPAHGCGTIFEFVAKA